MSRHLIVIAATILLLVRGVAAEVRDLPAAPSALVNALRTIVEENGAPGVAALVYRDGRLLVQEEAGIIDLEEPIPVASASKWVAAALIMTFVDEGRLSLDEPIALRMSTGNPEAGRITLRQILSFTSGQGSIESFADLAQPPDITLAESAARILNRPLEDPPGVVFKYGSGAMQVAGALVEQISGQSWEEMFRERLAIPLGMTRSWWTHPLHPKRNPATVTNPNLQGGLVTTAADYGRFLSMIANRGTYGGTTILSEEAIDLMETLQTQGMDMAYVPPFGDVRGMSHPKAKPTDSPEMSHSEQDAAPVQISDTFGYALGAWCERADAAGRCSLVSSPGVLGTWPWIDRDSGLYGIFVMEYRFPTVFRNLAIARQAILSDPRLR